MRKLASIQKVIKVEPIPDADAIEMIQVLGWELVSKKGEFLPGYSCVYCEIDSFLPIAPEFEFLRKNCYRKMADGAEGFRIKTVRLRGQISQGIAFPMSILPEGNYQEGDDVTDVLNIVKYEPPIPACLDGIKKGDFPSFLCKSDETRIQVLQPILTKYKGTPCYYSEKLDGSSMTTYVRDNDFGVAGRGLEFFENENNSLWKVARQLRLEEKLRSLNINIAYQGEIIGENIQGNKYKLKGQTAYCFNLFNIDRYEYFAYKDLIEITKKLDIPLVPILDDNFILTDDIPTLVNLAKRKSILNPNTDAEGIVIRPLETIQVGRSEFDFAGNRLSFKSINPIFLLNEKD